MKKLFGIVLIGIIAWSCNDNYKAENDIVYPESGDGFAESIELKAVADISETEMRADQINIQSQIQDRKII